MKVVCSFALLSILAVPAAVTAAEPQPPTQSAEPSPQPLAKLFVPSGKACVVATLSVPNFLLRGGSITLPGGRHLVARKAAPPAGFDLTTGKGPGINPVATPAAPMDTTAGTNQCALVLHACTDDGCTCWSCFLDDGSDWPTCNYSDCVQENYCV